MGGAKIVLGEHVCCYVIYVGVPVVGHVIEYSGSHLW
jgi:hypothetical protein